ncbi:MAG: tRNA (guanosine(46)-N7)-methyltransferase TrmB [Firmicutes bacterium HGW-Firmicutes-21]|nr:MAG: tRNA (guanosine(46)-N7)-methyltransferase TrmB [Firmicutes bacterium HGW-Firmicutes-21]
MRMRPKKNRAARMEKVSYLFAKTDENGRVDIMETFKKDGVASDKPLFLEIGCGKGAFVTELSRQNPDADIIAAELVTDVLMLAMEKADRENRTNIAFLNENADRTDIFMPEKSTDRLYLNFSDPWPRKKNSKRRLTSPLFLEKYKKILKDGARIYFKTDNIGLFEYSLETLKEAGFTLENICYDLHSSELSSNNIMTEYENNFSSKGFKINYLEAFFG